MGEMTRADSRISAHGVQRRHSLRHVVVLIVMLCSGLSVAGGAPNVVFIAVDDLRPELGCYGQAHIHSPHLNGLADDGVTFELAYCNVPTCAASRGSVMTGLRPSRERFVNWDDWAEQQVKGILPLNAWFKSHGYNTVSLGKVFHHQADFQDGWSTPPWRVGAEFPHYRLTENQRLHEARVRPGQKMARGPAWEAADTPEELYIDGQIAHQAVSELSRLKATHQPFFLAVGFMKPHLPFVAPKKYWDLYNPDQIKLSENSDPPLNAPPESLHTSGELRWYSNIPPTGPISSEDARSLIHGYYACVSHVDAQIGKVLDEVEQLQLKENTLVVVWGDHGWNLGEHGLWCKHSLYETSMRVPLIIRGPGIPGGRSINALAELLDLYPTLCDLCQIEAPGHLQGVSLAGLLRGDSTGPRDFAIGRYQQGDSIRSDRFRYSEFADASGAATARMLYDQLYDPRETMNIVGEDRYQRVADSLRRELHKVHEAVRAGNGN